MSSLGLATLGVQCNDKALGMASLGVFCGEVEVSPPAPTPGPTGGGGRGSGPTTGIRPMGYDKYHEDDLRETRHKRILQEDEDITALIVSMLMKDLL